MRIPELARMPHALDPEGGFRVRSKFTLGLGLINHPASGRHTIPASWFAPYSTNIF
jgi:hypothetical protein